MRDAFLAVAVEGALFAKRGRVGRGDGALFDERRGSVRIDVRWGRRKQAE